MTACDLCALHCPKTLRYVGIIMRKKFLRMIPA
jgi:hypothetical protein